MADETSIGWLFLSDAEQKKAREFLKSLTPEGTLDELGMGVIRNAIAGKLYPATNTLMTSPKYLLFVPAICIHIESLGPHGNLARRKLKDLEDALRARLNEGGEKRGVIGTVSGDQLQRYPSSIYWNAIDELAIAKEPGPLAYYLHHIESVIKSRKARKDDDGALHADHSIDTWDRDLYRLDLLEQIKTTEKKVTLALSLSEANYLAEKFLEYDAKHGEQSQLGHLIGIRHSRSFAYPWAAPCPDNLRQLVNHARMFSIFGRGAVLHYYHLLCRKRAEDKIDNTPDLVVDAFAKWWEFGKRELASWDAPEFFKICNRNKWLRDGDDAFIQSWLSALNRSRDPMHLLNSDEAKLQIVFHEHSRRLHKARLSNRAYLEHWKTPEQLEYGNDRDRYSFDFRADVGNSFVHEIVSALGGSN